MPCRAQKFNMSLVVAGLPRGLPDNDFCPDIKAKATAGIGLGTTPTTCKRPFGFKA